MTILGALLQLAILAAGPAAEPPANVSALLERAESAYFAGKIDEAWAELEKATALDATEVAIPPDRPRLFVLRAVVRLKRNDPAGAKEEARAALLIDPTLTAEDYSTEVFRLFEAVRDTLPRRVVLRFSGIPAGGETRLDGRLVPAGVIQVLPGSHQLVVRAPQHQTLATTIDAKEDAEIPIALVPIVHGRSRYAAPVWFGVSATSLAVSAWALHGLSVTRENRSSARPEQRKHYDPHLLRFTAGSFVGVTTAAVTGTLGVRAWRAKPMAVGVVPFEGGAVVVWAARFP